MKSEANLTGNMTRKEYNQRIKAQRESVQMVQGNVGALRASLADKRQALSTINAVLRRDNQQRASIKAQRDAVLDTAKRWEIKLDGFRDELRKELAREKPSREYIDACNGWIGETLATLRYWHDKQAGIDASIDRQIAVRCLSLDAVQDIKAQRNATQRDIDSITKTLEFIAVKREAIDAIDALELTLTIQRETHRVAVRDEKKQVKKDKDFAKWLARKQAKEAATYTP